MSHVGQVAAEPPRAAEGGFFALMRHRNYALLWTGQLVSQIGDRFHWVAISLWVYTQTGSALSVSYVMMALLGGSAVVGPFAGVLVDRLDRRKILIYGDLSRAALVFAIPQLMEYGLMWVYLDTFLVSVATAFFRPAMFAAIPQSVPKRQLLQANAFFASMSQSTEVFGPALAGLVAAWRGYSAAIYLNAVSFLVSAIFVSALRLQQPRHVEEDGGKAVVPGVFQSIRVGLNYVRSDPIQRALLALLFGGFWVVGLNSLQTPLAKGVLAISDRQFGWYQGIWGVGFVTSSLLLGWFGGRLSKGRTIVFGYIMWALATATMGLSSNYGMLVVTGFWVGFANMLVLVNVTTVMMEHTPSDKIGRAITTRQILIAVMSLIAMLGFGLFADLTGVREAIVVMATISLVGTILASVRFPGLLRYDLHGEAPEPRAYNRWPSGFPRALSRTVVNLFEAHTSPEYAIRGQRTLNAASLAVVAVGWLLLLAKLPGPAVGIAITIAGTFAAATILRPIGRRLIASFRRPEEWLK